MSQVPPSSADATSDAPKKKGGGTLRVILFAVLLVMLGLLGWDLYARKASKKLSTDVEVYVDEVKRGLKEYTPDDVHKLAGRQPDNGMEDRDSYALENYSWPRGILVKSYVVKVIYRKEGDKVLLHEVALNRELEQNDLPSAPSEAATPPTGSELEPPPSEPDEESPAASEAGEENAVSEVPAPTE